MTLKRALTVLAALADRAAKVEDATEAFRLAEADLRLAVIRLEHAQTAFRTAEINLDAECREYELVATAGGKA